MVSNNAIGPVAEDVVVKKILQRVRVFPPHGDASLGDGATKVMYIMHYPHQALPNTVYNGNLSNDSAAGGAYEFYDYLDNEMTNTTPANTAFDIVIKVAINTTHGWNSTFWDLDLHNATVQGTAGYTGFTGDVAMNETEIGNSSTWNFVHYYVQDGDGGSGNGFQIGQNVATNASFEFWAYQ